MTDEPTGVTAHLARAAARGATITPWSVLIPAHPGERPRAREALAITVLAQASGQEGAVKLRVLEDMLNLPDDELLQVLPALNVYAERIHLNLDRFTGRIAHALNAADDQGTPWPPCPPDFSVTIRWALRDRLRAALVMRAGGTLSRVQSVAEVGGHDTVTAEQMVCSLPWPELQAIEARLEAWTALEPDPAAPLACLDCSAAEVKGHLQVAREANDSRTLWQAALHPKAPGAAAAAFTRILDIKAALQLAFPAVTDRLIQRQALAPYRWLRAGGHDPLAQALERADASGLDLLARVHGALGPLRLGDLVALVTRPRVNELQRAWEALDALGRAAHRAGHKLAITRTEAQTLLNQGRSLTWTLNALPADLAIQKHLTGNAAASNLGAVATTVRLGEQLPPGTDVGSALRLAGLILTSCADPHAALRAALQSLHAASDPNRAVQDLYDHHLAAWQRHWRATRTDPDRPD